MFLHNALGGQILYTIAGTQAHCEFYTVKQNYNFIRKWVHTEMSTF